MVNMNYNSMFMSSMYGLQNTYNSALQDGEDGITRQDVLDTQQQGFLNGTTPFSSYMSTKFMEIDKNSDGKIAADEMQTLMNDFSSSGMTYDQIMSFSASGQLNDEDVSMILKNFTKIDKNGDGRVSMSELNYFSINKEMDDKIAELKKQKLSDISFMYEIDDYEDL